MTKSTITRERLEWLSQISCRDDIEDIGGDEIRELASMALAAMGDAYDITASQLREAVHYNPDTGRFTRRSNGTPMEHLCGSGYYCLNLFKRSRLAAAPQSPGSEPATVPGKWIPVSEQMPPSRYEVLVGRWWGEKQRWCCKWATYIPGHPDAQSSGWLIPGGSWTPTHWMELPAAPQEVNHD